ncbi:glycosyltransferase family 2 protein [Salinigranum sp.]|uniref:glycosyltransferase family 2 protein n=1 Tax=Salinigranum sp. TaxID=1966351 RepID=UPI00356710DC
MRRTLFGTTVVLFVLAGVALGAGVGTGQPPGVGAGAGQAPPDAGPNTGGGNDQGLLGSLSGGALALVVGTVDVGTHALLWASLLVFGGVALTWVVTTYVVGGGYRTPAPAYGPDDVQVRILTVDAESVVQGTVDSLPDALVDRHVVAEEPLDVDGATVHVVPDDFECDAVRKGRAVEWARRTLDCDREFVLYLDEDSVLESFDGLPEGDVVQLRERPQQTGSVLSYLADVYRMGVQFEQRAFARLSIPLFAWGGGIAVRTDVEEAVTWDRASLVEDTAFVWAAARGRDLDFELADVVCRNQAPPSLTDVLQQRRRWAAGNHAEASRLPLHYRLLTRVRNYAWALSPLFTAAVVPLTLAGAVVVDDSLYRTLSVALGALTAFWYVRGALWYRSSDGSRALGLLLALPLLPVVSVVHSAGTVWGLLDPPERFRVTTKAT